MHLYTCVAMCIFVMLLDGIVFQSGSDADAHHRNF